MKPEAERISMTIEGMTKAGVLIETQTSCNTLLLLVLKGNNKADEAPKKASKYIAPLLTAPLINLVSLSSPTDLIKSNPELGLINNLCGNKGGSLLTGMGYGDPMMDP
jgi:hypothetical protein